jgi:tight adherence protein C
VSPTSWLQILLVASTGIALVMWYRVVRGQRAVDRVMQDHGLELTDAGDAEFREIIASTVPAFQFRRETVRKELLAAGYYRPTAQIDYAYHRNLSVGLFVVAGLLLALFVPARWMVETLIAVAVLAGLAFSTPYAYLTWQVRRRRSEIERGLPVAVDMIAMSLGAGQDLASALKWVSRELKSAHPVLASELELVTIQAGIGNLDLALRKFADRVQVPHVTHVVRILTQSQRLGTDISMALREIANSFRSTMRQDAEARANRLGFWMLMPNIFCLFLACAIVVIGPVALQFTQSGAKTRELMKQSRQMIQKANPQERAR